MGTWFDRSVMKGLLNASMVGIHLVVSTFVGFGIGYFLDSFLKTSWLKWVFLCLGIVAGFRDLFRFAKQDNGQSKQDNGESKKDL